MVVINAKIICKIVLDEDDIQQSIEEFGTRESAIYHICLEELGNDINIKDADFIELFPS